VEITMMSLYIKLLEGERGAIMDRRVLPPLQANIKCGNSLIGYDIREQSGITAEDLDRIKPFDWHSQREGFGDILAAGGFDAVIGNPPYVRMESFKELKDYLKANYACHDERSDLYAYMIEKSQKLLSKNGRFGMIVSNKFLRANYGKPLRDFLQKHYAIERIVDFAGLPVFTGATVRTIVLITTRGKQGDYVIHYTPPLPVDRFETLATSAMPVEEAITQGCSVLRHANVVQNVAQV